ncbi:UxaA family hydrolase [Crassaminicella profunda]|uniref:UxaA family hydrolase n=1 Tax=Crassaminicella profunda TaxID=1286698 RepID=UPI001CA7281D|nr:UxaA family hydrolase [Crassaminicella profunda]QZY54945.1 UxaA family hydrolase [Crassaminicella profunda]
MGKKMMLMGDKDIVATALDDIENADIVSIMSSDNQELYTMEAKEDIPFGNKIALRNIEKGERIIKYNVPVGECIKNIEKGRLVHVHNVKSQRVDIPKAFKEEIIKQMNINTEV